jgi:hypothetical protein
VDELDWKFQALVLKSTIPVTCPDTASASSSEPCELELSISTTSDIAVRQRLPGEDPRQRKLRYVFKETDWKDGEKLAYNEDSPLEIVGRVSVFHLCEQTLIITVCTSCRWLCAVLSLFAYDNRFCNFCLTFCCGSRQYLIGASFEFVK